MQSETASVAQAVLYKSSKDCVLACWILYSTALPAWRSDDCNKMSFSIHPPPTIPVSTPEAGSKSYLDGWPSGKTKHCEPVSVRQCGP